MKLITAKPSRLHCASCDETLNVPQNCNIRLYKELRCPLDDYELLYCTTGTSGKVCEHGLPRVARYVNMVYHVY